MKRWILSVMPDAGLDVSFFKLHSRQSTSRSKAFSKNVPIDAIMKAGKWKSEFNFSHVYSRWVESPGSSSVFANSVLDGS